MNLEIQGKQHLDKTVAQDKDSEEDESLHNEKAAPKTAKVAASQTTAPIQINNKASPQATSQQ